MGRALLLLLAIPIVELFVIVQVTQAIGFWWMLLALVGLSIFGTFVIRYAGWRAWRRFTSMDGATTVGNEVADGILVFLAGLLLVIPGFVTGALGLALLVPPVRAVFRQRVQHRVARARSVRLATATYDRSGTTWETTATHDPSRPVPSSPPPALDPPAEPEA